MSVKLIQQALREIRMSGDLSAQKDIIKSYQDRYGYRLAERIRRALATRSQ